MMQFSLIALVLLPACTQHGNDETPPETTACESGFILDGSTCVPESCGVGRWGDLPVDDDTVYVDVAAGEGGDGTESAPFSTIGPAVERAGALDGRLVALSAGTYPETLWLTSKQADVRLAGRCRELTILDASVGDAGTPGIVLDALDLRAEVSGLTVHGSSNAGIVVVSGDLTVRDSTISGSADYGVVAYHFYTGWQSNLSMDGCIIEENTGQGLFVANPDTRVALTNTTVRDTQPATHGGYGRGIEVQDGAKLSLTDCVVERNADAGLAVIGMDAEATLRGTTVRDTHPNGNGANGRGVVVQEGATLSADACLFEENTEAGLFIDSVGSRASLVDTTVRDTRPNSDGVSGYGIEVHNGATLSVDGSLIDGNATAGVFVSEAGTRVALRNTTIEDTWPDAHGYYGRGLEIDTGATLVAEGCLIAENHEIAAFISESGTEVILVDTTVRDTQTDVNGRGGRGIGIDNGATLLAERCLIEGHTELGIQATGACQVTLRDTVVRGTLLNADGMAGYGIAVSDGSSLSADGCSIEENVEVGLLAADADTRISLRDSAISGTRRSIHKSASAAFGVVMEDGAYLYASRVLIESHQGPGILVNGDGGFAELAGCTIRDNQFAGAAVMWGGMLSISDSTIERTTPSVNLLGGAGVYAWPWLGGPPTLRITGTLIRDNSVAGVWLLGEGAYVLTDNTISGGDRKAFGSGSRCGDGILAFEDVTAWDGQSGLLLRGNLFQDAMGAGVFLNGASALLSGNGYSGNAVDLVVQDQDCEALPDCYSEAPQHEYCPVYDHPTCYNEFFYQAMPVTLEEGNEVRLPISMESLEPIQTVVDSPSHHPGLAR